MGTIQRTLVGLLLGLSATAQAHEERILFIGDSHTVGTFGQTLDTLLRSIRGARVLTVGSCGMSPDAFLHGYRTPCGYFQSGLDWRKATAPSAPTPLIGALLRESGATLTVVALGANQINTATTNPEKARRDIRALADEIVASGSRCAWVGPPDGLNKPEPRRSQLYSVLQGATAGRCSFFDSRPEKLPYLDYARLKQEAGEAGRKADGAHYDSLGETGRRAARLWALDVLRFVTRAPANFYHQ